jgi:hypothetical protein
MIPGRYSSNIQALIATLQSATEKNISVLLYIVPLRNDAERPYNVEQYSNFKEEIKLLAKEYKVQFADLESLVPSNEWGNKNSTSLDGGDEIDFMHFQAGGHLRLAEAIDKNLEILQGENQ